MTWIDAIVALLLLAALLRGWQRGIVVVLMGMGSLVAALLLARGLAGPFVAGLDARFGWVGQTSAALRQASMPVLGGAVDGLQQLPAANRWLAETYDRLAVSIWTVLFALVLFGVIALGLNLVARLVTKGLDLTPLALPNRLLGAVLNTAIIGFVLGSICAILLSIPGLDWRALTESYLAPQLAAAVQTLLAGVLGAIQANGS